MTQQRQQNSTLVIVPTYNEAENIRALLERVCQFNVDVLIVDDSSPDGTADIVRDIQKTFPQISILSRPKKDGLAGAYIAGFHWGLERGYESLIEMDADFSHSPGDLPRFIEALKTSDVVIGCRYMQGGGIEGWGLTRQAISRGGNVYAQTILGMKEQDLTGGFNGWRAKVLRNIHIDTIRSKGYAFQVELKYRAKQCDFTIQEIPIHFANRIKGKSKMTGSIVYEAAYRVWEMKRNRKAFLIPSPA